MPNSVYLATSDRDTLYPSISSNYKPKGQTVSTDAYAIPLLWLALFREENYREQTFDLPAGPVTAFAPIGEVQRCLGQLRASLAFLEKALPGYRSLAPHAEMLASAIASTGLAYVSIELQELEWLAKDIDDFRESLRLIARGFSGSGGSSLSRLLGRRPEQAWLKAVREVTSLQLEFDFPPEDLLLVGAPAAEEDMKNLTRLLGSSLYRDVPWETSNPVAPPASSDAGPEPQAEPEVAREGEASTRADADGMQLIHYHHYTENRDFTGSVLFRLGRPKAEIASSVGGLMSKADMPLVRRPVEFTCSHRGELPDEVHHWPRAVMGGTPYEVKLFFKNEVLEGEKLRPLGRT